MPVQRGKYIQQSCDTAESMKYKETCDLLHKQVKNLGLIHSDRIGLLTAEKQTRTPIINPTLCEDLKSAYNKLYAGELHTVEERILMLLDVQESGHLVKAAEF